MPIINLLGLSPAAILIGEPGSSVDTGPKHTLRGSYRLQIGDRKSESIAFGASGPIAIVEPVGGDVWVLRDVNSTTFVFTPSIQVHDGSAGPWIGCSQISVQQVPDSKRTAYLSFDDVGFSLVGYQNHQPGGQPRLFFPTSGLPVAYQTLRKLPHPEGGYDGFFLVPFEGGFAVHAQASNQAQLDAAVAVTVDVNDDCDLYFRICDSTGIFAARLAIVSSPAAFGSRVWSDPASDGRLMSAPLPSGGSWNGLDMRISRLETSGSFLRAVRFFGDEVALGIATSAAVPVEKTTLLYTPTSRLSFELELPATPPVGPAFDPAARFIYRKPFATTPLAARRERFFGVRVQGLGDRRGQRAVLEADVAVIDLAGGASRKFRMLAGDNVPSGKSAEPSRLSPKPDPKDGRAIISVPAGDVELRITNDGQASPLVLNTETNSLVVRNSRLGARPLGITSRPGLTTNSDGVNAFASWNLLQRTDTHLAFTLVAEGLRPVLGQKWLDDFVTADPQLRYTAIEHPGTTLAMDPPKRHAFRASQRIEGEGETKITVTTRPTDGKEIAVYSALIAGMSWAAVKCRGGSCFDNRNFLVSFTALTTEQAKAYVKQNGVGDLIVVYAVGRDGAGSTVPSVHTEGIKTFIDGNMALQVGPKPERYFWPFLPLLVIPLYERSKDGTETYVYDVQRPGSKDFKTRIAFDLSGLNGLSLDDYGWDESAYNTVRQQAPALWPRGSLVGAAQRQGPRSDPSDPTWRGIFFRDLPLKLTIAPDAVGTQSTFIQSLLEKVNQRLVLDYGWQDETGATWLGGVHLSVGEEIDFTPGSDGPPQDDKWSSFLKLYLRSLTVKGAGGRVVAAEAEVRFRLNALTTTGGKPLELTGGFGLDLEGSKPIQRIEISAAPGSTPIATESVPGFAQIELLRMVTDLATTIRVEIGLVATAELAAALPFLSTDPSKKQLAILTLPLGDTPTGTIALAVPNGVETNLFGRWPLTVTGIVLTLGPEPQLVVGGRLHLGIPGFDSVGGRVIVTKRADGLKFNILLDQIAGHLSFGQMRIDGSLNWGDANASTTEMGLPAVPKEGAARDFNGYLNIHDPGVIGDLSLLCKIGNRGESTYWIGSIVSGTKVNLGIGELARPGLIVAHNADFSGCLREMIDDPNSQVLAKLCPPKPDDIPGWLSQWGPSANLGTLVAGTGYYNCHSKIASAPVPSGADDPSLLSSLVFSDSGLLRVDGVLAVLENAAATLRFALVIDYQNKLISGGVQIPTINIPPTGSPQYQIQPGFVELGVGFKNTFRFRMGIGWPPLLANSTLERDWSKSTKVYVAGMFPINTFWGGFLAELTNDSLFYGFAIKAGWTWNYAVGGSFARASADLEISLGGVFEFKLTWGEGKLNAQPSPLSLMSLANPHLASPSPPDCLSAHIAAQVEAVRELHEVAATSIAEMAHLNLCVRATIYGDVIGNASLEFLGITLAALHVHAYARFQVCGSTNDGLTLAWARVGFDVSVTIACVTFHAPANIDIYLRQGSCNCIDGRDFSLLSPVVA